MAAQRGKGHAVANLCFCRDCRGAQQVHRDRSLAGAMKAKLGVDLGHSLVSVAGAVPVPLLAGALPSRHHGGSQHTVH